jgi:hypothetical protein
MRTLAQTGWLALALAATAGCGGGAVRHAPVEGRVFFRGAPLAGGTIVFAPDPGHGASGPLAVGEIDAQGRYRLRTDGGEGAPVGWHRVTVAAGPGAPDFPARYGDPERSGLCREVADMASNVIDLQLE